MTYIKNGKKVTKQEFMADAIGFDFDRPTSFVAGSFKPFISPIDGKEIINSKQLCDHNRRYNVQQVGHEFETVVHKNKMENENARQCRQSGN